jgi:hypothetical protein
MEINYKTLVLIALFGLLFAVVGWVAPAAYATYAPQDHYIESTNFTVNDVQVSDETHTLCFTRTIHKQSVGEVFTELYLIDEDGQRIEIDSDRKELVFQEGEQTIRIVAKMPEHIREGSYRYQRVYNMELANGRIDRRFSFTSDTFTVRNGAGTLTQDPYC